MRASNPNSELVSVDHTPLQSALNMHSDNENINKIETYSGSVSFIL